MTTRKALWLLVLAAVSSRAQQDTSSLSISTLNSTIAESQFTGTQYTYITGTSQITVQSSSSTTPSNVSANATATGSQTSSTPSLTELVGGSSSNATASSTTSSAMPSNTVPCNNYPEFCNRKYSNITEICAHNSAFAVKNNAASNQQFPVTDQLNDGIRMLESETHYVNDTLYMCHTSCDLLNAGPLQDYLTTVTRWVRNNPYNVVSIILSNSDLVNVEKYVPAIENSGIRQYAYEPEYIPQRRDQWPTLGEMILTGKRVVFYMDYNANQTAVPYILDQYTHMWETPFSPQDPAFPCDIQRPPKLNTSIAVKDYMYLANHNLNIAIDISAILGNNDNQQILVPAFSSLDITNGDQNEYGRLGAMNVNCTTKWGVPPNFFVVDFYNIGSPFNGSVFQVAADANGVTYNRAQCCANGESEAPPQNSRSSFFALAGALCFAVLSFV